MPGSVGGESAYRPDDPSSGDDDRGQVPRTRPGFAERAGRDGDGSAWGIGCALWIRCRSVVDGQVADDRARVRSCPIRPPSAEPRLSGDDESPRSGRVRRLPLPRYGNSPRPTDEAWLGIEYLSVAPQEP